MYEDIDEDIRINFEILYLKTLLSHKRYRDDIMDVFEASEDIFEDIFHDNGKATQMFNEDVLEIYAALLNKMILVSQNNDYLHTIIEIHRDRILNEIRKRKDRRAFYDLLDKDEIDEDDEGLLDRVTNCCPYYALEVLAIVQVIILDIDRVVRDANTYKGSYNLDIAINDILRIYKSINSSDVCTSMYQIREAILHCLDYLYVCKGNHSVLRIYSSSKNIHLFDIIL